MKQTILFGAITLLAGSLLAADSNPQDAVKDAAKKLGEKDNYSWTTTIDLGGDMTGTIDGKAEKAGATTLALSAAGRKIVIVGFETLPRRMTRLLATALPSGFVVSCSSPTSPFSLGAPLGQSGICSGAFAPDAGEPAKSAMRSGMKQKADNLFMTR